MKQIYNILKAVDNYNLNKNDEQTVKNFLMNSILLEDGRYKTSIFMNVKLKSDDDIFKIVNENFDINGAEKTEKEVLNYIENSEFWKDLLTSTVKFYRGDIIRDITNKDIFGDINVVEITKNLRKILKGEEKSLKFNYDLIFN